MTSTLFRVVLASLFVNAAAAAVLPPPRFSLDPASPSITGNIASDDVLRPGPGIAISGRTLGLQDDFAGGVFDYLDALSFGRDVIANPLYFSVDRVAVGVQGSAVFAEAAPGVADAAPDVYVALPPVNTNALVIEGRDLGLIGGFFGDDLGALEFDRRRDHVYFSFDALSATNEFGTAAAAGDIYLDAFPSLFASGPLDIGLDPLDDLDALVLDDRVEPGVLNRGVDRALFSLSAFSPSTFTFTGLDYIPCVPQHMSPADVCATSFLRSYGVWAPARTIGLLPDDNLDALDTTPVPEPGSVLLLAIAIVAMIAIARVRNIGRWQGVRSATCAGLLLTAAVMAGQAQAQCAPPLEFDHQFVGNSPPFNGSAATLMLRLVDKRFRFIATDPLGETDTQTIGTNKFVCFRNSAVVPCCNAGISRVIFESKGDRETVRGDVLLAPYSRAVVDLARDTSRIRYLLVPCASTPVISGGRPKYRGQFKDKVFRRGQDIPKFSIPIADLAGGTPVIDIFKAGDATKVRRLTSFSKQGNLMVATWDWKNDRGWEIPGKIPVGEYTVVAKSSAGGKEVQTGQCVFWVIFHKPSALTRPQEAAYLYDKANKKRDEQSIHHNRYSNQTVVRDANGKPLRELVNKVMVNKERFKTWQEAVYKLDPFDENLFKLAINAVDGQTDEPATAEALQNAISNVIDYTQPNGAADVATMFRAVKVKEFKDAFGGTEKALIQGQCLDYANSLTAFARTVGIPGRVATDIQNGGFKYHEWTEIFLQNPPAGTDKWYTFDAMDYYPTDKHKTDAAAPPQGSARRSEAPYGSDAYEVPVGGTNWVAEPGHMELDFTVSRLKRVRNTNDALFEKCEGKKYDDTTCNQPDPPVEDASPYLKLRLSSDAYEVGEEIVADATVTNVDPSPLKGTARLTLSRYATGEDGRAAFGDPILGVDGSGIFGTPLFETSFAVSLSPGASTARQFRFVLPSTDFPYDRYLASLEIIGGVEDQVTLDFSGIPGFDVEVTMPNAVGPLDLVPIVVKITNEMAIPITNIAAALTFPEFYELLPGPVTTVPVLAVGETRSLAFTIRPRERNRVASLPMRLDVRSANAGRLVQNLEPQVVTPATLFVPSTAIVRPAAATFPVTFTVQNIGSVDAHSVMVHLGLPSDAPPGSIVLATTDFVLASLPAGEEHTFSTLVTTFLPTDVHIDIAAAAPSAEPNSGLLSINVP